MSLIAVIASGLVVSSVCTGLIRIATRIRDLGTVTVEGLLLVLLAMA